MQTERNLFEDFIFNKWKTMTIVHQRNGDWICYKDFTKKGNKYCITARFTENGDYCYGYLTDENGTAIVNGKGFDIDTFIEHCKLAFRMI